MSSADAGVDNPVSSMASPLPLVSIVTPSLNQGDYVDDAIRSVLDQTYPNVEHIVVDGGSSDGTLDVLRRYPHLTVVSEPDDGQADAINKGFRLARGEIYGWINADDFYLPDAVAIAVDAIRESGCALVHGSWRQVDARGRLLREVKAVEFDYGLQLQARNAVAQPGAFFTREAFEAVGGLDHSYRYALDYELWLRIGKRFPVRHVDATLAAFRYHSSSKTVAESDGFLRETILASRRHGGRRFSPLYLDWYLPRRRPWVHRGVLAYRLAAGRDYRSLVRRIAGRGRPS